MPLDGQPAEVIDNEQDSVRAAYADALSATVDTPSDAPVDAPVTDAVVDKPESTTDAKGDVETSVADARSRDEKGRFAAAEKAKADAAAAAAPAVDPAAPVVPMQAPKAWKPEHHETFKALPKNAQDYITQREREMHEGFAKYQSEVNARYAPLNQVLEPHLPLMQQAGVTPENAVKASLDVYKNLVFGDPNQRLKTLLDLAHYHNVPLSDYITQGGALPQYNPQQQRQMPAQPQPQADVQTLVNQALEAREIQNTVKGFSEAKDAQGSLLHPHYEDLKPAMIGLLQSGLASDLESAYAKALRMDDNLWAQHQQSQTAAAAAEKAAQAQAAAARAKAKSVSVTDSTRSANMNTDSSKGIRDIYAEKFNAADRV